MRGWSIPVVLAFAAACSSDDRNGPGVPPDVPASLSSTTLDGAVALTWSDNSYASDPGNLPELPHLQHDLRPRQRSLRHQLPAGGNHGGPGVHRRRAGQRRAALLHRDGGERGRVRERSLATAVGHAPSRHAEHRAVRVPVSDDREAASGSGTISTATAACRERSWACARRARAASIDFVVDRDGAGDLFLTPDARRHRRGVLRREQPGRGSDVDRLRRGPHYAHVRDPGASGVWLCLRDGWRRRLQALRRGAGLHVGQDFLILDWAFQTDPGKSRADRQEAITSNVARRRAEIALGPLSFLTARPLVAVANLGAFVPFRRPSPSPSS